MPALADTLDRRRPEHEANRAAQLAQLEGDEQALGALPVSDDDHTPRRLKSLLGEDHNQS